MSPHALIIDDNPLNVDVLAIMLQQEGARITAVSLPCQLSEAIDHIERIDAVFLDLEFPKEDGFDVFKYMKAMALFAQTPIVAYTVHISEIDRARRAGFDGFLGKPLSLQRFSQQWQDILSGKPVWEV